MASVAKRGKRWTVRWRDPDGGARQRTVATKATAEELRRDVESAVGRGERWEPRGARPEPLVRAVAAAWLRARAVRLARRTLIRYGQMAEAFVGWLETREGKGVRMRAFSRALLEDYWRELTAGSSGRWGGDRAVSTARKHLEVVRLLWEWAHDREEYDGQVPRPREVDLPRRAVTAPALAPSWAQMDDAIVTARGWLRCLFVVLRCTGLRVSQAMGLRWEDVQADSLRVRPELGKSQSEKHGRLIPLAPVLLEELDRPLLCLWDRSEPWLVPSRTTGRQDPDAAPRRSRDARSRDAARVWARTTTPKQVWEKRPDHAFRKGFVTGLRSLGADPWAVEVLVGHRLPGEQAAYVDVHQAFRLREAVALVPALPVVPCA